MPKKKQIPDREDWDPNEWGNIQHPTLSDEEVLKKYWDRSSAVKEQWAKNPGRRILSKKHLKKIKKMHNNSSIQKKRIANLKKAMKDPLVKKRCAVESQKRSQDPIYQKQNAEKWRKVAKDKNIQKKRIANLKKALQTDEYKKKKRVLALELGIKCQVKKPGKDWKTFGSFTDATRYFDWSNLSSTPKRCFPEDGSIRQWKRKLRKGWQTRRING